MTGQMSPLPYSCQTTLSPLASKLCHGDLCLLRAPLRGGWMMQLGSTHSTGVGSTVVLLTLLQVSLVGFLEESTGLDSRSHREGKRGAAEEWGRSETIER